GIGSSFSQKDYPNPSCPLCAVVALAWATGLRTISGHPVHACGRCAALGRQLVGSRVPCPQVVPLWASPLYGLAAGAAPAAWPWASAIPCELAAGSPGHLRPPL
ncbi:hypothetical protein BHE74_00049418, partial [Ensete ventricosum]